MAKINTPIEVTIAQAADAAKSKANTLSLEMYNLIGIVKLAAFAAEARRTLEEIQEMANCRPAIKEAISGSNWRERDDNMGEVLDCVARQLDEVRIEFNETVHSLAWATKPDDGGSSPLDSCPTPQRTTS